MEDEDKIYWLKIVLGIACGILSIFVIPQSLVAQGVHVGWLRFAWLMGTWLLLPIPIVMLGLRLGWLGIPQKEKNRRENAMRRAEASISTVNPGPVQRFVMKDAYKKIGGWKYILKTGVGAYFFLFLLTSTIVFTLMFPAP
ncbi:MAG TPA: hypothetical protein VKM55_26765 [Candidatus Lokiarchaeia archaeon]|nr:hypothetical protein [Candidatus Lokiarchaeia archaeon]